MVSKTLIATLFKYGLGEFLVVHGNGPHPLLGQLAYEKGKLVLKDRALLKGVLMAQIGPCYDIGIVGAICQEDGNEWETLTFVGPELCHLKQDLSATRVNLMAASTNEFNERLLDFHGSVHRGFRLMIDSHFLPVVLMQEIILKSGKKGLAVSNLRVAGVSFDVLGTVHERLNELVEKNNDLDVQDMTMDRSDFDSLFAKYTTS